MVCDILKYQGQHEVKNLQALHGMRTETEEQQMITNEYGIHTFSLKLQCKYSEIQNIIRKTSAFAPAKKLGLFHRITKCRSSRMSALRYSLVSLFRIRALADIDY